MITRPFAWLTAHVLLWALVKAVAVLVVVDRAEGKRA